MIVNNTRGAEGNLIGESYTVILRNAIKLFLSRCLLISNKTRLRNFVILHYILLYTMNNNVYSF